MPDAQPKPTAAQVLREHHGRGLLFVSEQHCACGWEPDREAVRDKSAPFREQHTAHQEDMLAAAGLLATAEHDAQVAEKVLRDAADAWQFGGWADDMPAGSSRPALILGMAQRATDWLRARADRVAQIINAEGGEGA